MNFLRTGALSSKKRNSSQARLSSAIVAPILRALPVTFDPWDQRGIAEIMAGSERAAAFIQVWRVHTGSYVGGALGLLLAMALIRRQRAVGD